MNQHSHAQFERALLRAQVGPIEWQTVALVFVCHAVWAGGELLYPYAPWLSVPLLALSIVLHSSLQHEAIHRHPTRSDRWNEALVFLPLGLLYPYRRYQDTHLRHHVDSRLTDPYDDPESAYLAKAHHQRLPLLIRLLLVWNATLAGRILIGPAIAAIRFLLVEARNAINLRGAKARRWRGAWALHGLGLAMVLGIIHFVFAMPLVAYLGAVYLAMALLGVRGFCEHRWAEAPDARSVIVEHSMLGLLFLNNNLHLVHHKQPHLPWYALPAAYKARRAEWLAINNGYVFVGYRAVLRSFALRAKEPVVHPSALRLAPDTANLGALRDR
ncbi:fatty acid desaturase [Novosphingobium sp. FKTRR1]|uniref:fatty acid desaturase n=1 Tax=Novosphingobium sp. FKTRR1 TaxID=2879118 RepID=UPI001CF0C268|nr:fatty acid desaturase [Novosphingobium sp. FKTRR1]